MDNGFNTTADFIRATDALMVHGRYVPVWSVEIFTDNVVVSFKRRNQITLKRWDKVRVLAGAGDGAAK